MMKKLSELTPDQISALFTANSFLRDRARDYAEESANIVVSDILNPFNRMHGVDYNIGCTGNYFTVAQEAYNDFLTACGKHDFALFPEELKKQIDRAAEKAHFFVYCVLGYEDISEKRFFQLEKWMNEIVERAAQEIVSFCDMEYTAVYSETTQREAAEMFCDCNNDYETDGKIIYETSRRQYA